MATNGIETEVRACVDALVADLTGLIRRAAIETLRAALDPAGIALPSAGAPARRRKAGRKAGAGPGRKAGRGGAASGRRSSKDLGQLAAALLEYVTSNPGQRLEQIGAEIGMTTKNLRRPVTMLLGSGALRTEGQRRGTRYFPGGEPKSEKPKASKRKAAKRKKGARKARRKSKG